MWEKIKLFRTYLDRKDVFTILLIISISGISFMLGKLSEIEQKRVPVTVEMISLEEGATNVASVVMAEDLSLKKEPQAIESASKKTIQVEPVIPVAKNYVASKAGTKYHLPSCSGAKRISEKNKIWFATKVEAEQAGFTPASNCKGI